MSIEAQLVIKATFESNEKAGSANALLKEALKSHEYDLAGSLDSLNPTIFQKEHEGEAINVESIKKNINSLSITAYTYTSEEPTWFIKSFFDLGANRIHIWGQWDSHVQNYYFINGEKVTKKKFDGNKLKKKLSSKDIKINSNLFLPEGRVFVNSTLISYSFLEDIYETVLMEFVTDVGNKFYHKTTGKLKEMAYEGGPKKCKFYATFERGKLNGEFVSFAKRPTKIAIDITGSTEEITVDDLIGTWRIQYNEGILAEEDIYWVFDRVKFICVYPNGKVGPKNYTISRSHIVFIDDEIKLVSLNKNKLMAYWKWDCELKKIDKVIEISDSDLKSNFTMRP